MVENGTKERFMSAREAERIERLRQQEEAKTAVDTKILSTLRFQSIFNYIQNAVHRADLSDPVTWQSIWKTLDDMGVFLSVRQCRSLWALLEPSLNGKDYAYVYVHVLYNRVLDVENIDSGRCSDTDPSPAFCYHGSGPMTAQQVKDYDGRRFIQDIV